MTLVNHNLLIYNLFLTYNYISLKLIIHDQLRSYWINCLEISMFISSLNFFWKLNFQKKVNKRAQIYQENVRDKQIC